MLRSFLLTLLLAASANITHAIVPADELQRRWKALADELPDTAVLILLPAEHAV